MRETELKQGDSVTEPNNTVFISGKFLIMAIIGFVVIFGSAYITIKIAESKVKKIELLSDAFNNQGAELFCKDQIVSTKSGWSLEGVMLIKQDRFYDLRDCFARHD